VSGASESKDTPMMWGYGLNWLSMTLMMLGSTLWIVLLVVLAWAVIRWLNQRTGPSNSADTDAARERPHSERNTASTVCTR